LGLLVGFDGGGAKTAAALCDGDGRVLARAMGPGSAIVGLPGDDFYATLDALLSELLTQAGATAAQVDRVALGLSGVDFADETVVQRRLIAERFGLGERLVLVNDGLVALWALSPADRVALFQHGTGVTTAYRAKVGEERIFDSLDIAEVFDLRRAAISVTARMIDGRADPAPLGERVLAHCGVAAPGFAEWCMRSPDFRARRNSLAEVVFAAWRAGDAAADAIVRQAAQDYALTVAAIGRRLGEAPFEVSLSGGVIKQGGPTFQVLLEGLLGDLCPAARRIDPALSPELGALVLAAWDLGREPRGVFEQLAGQANVQGVPA